MKSKFLLAIYIVFLSINNNYAVESTPGKIRMLYSSLDPQSISEYLAFYQLYPDTPQGKLALQDAWKLLTKNNKVQQFNLNNLPNISTALEAIVALVNKEPNEQTPHLSNDDLVAVENLSSHLGNRKLKGHQALSEKEVIAMQADEIDLARGLFLSQFGSSREALTEIRSYEAVIDLMALQVLTQLPKKPSHEQTIKAINQFIFSEMGFRFPPHSQYAKDIDVYTFLPSVLDSRKGVCLGVSILYLCLAQRLELPLEMITPPGHIYVRYRNGNKIINIETTARGVHVDDEEYLSIETSSLQQRNLKEVIGFAHVNQASVYLQEGDYKKSLACYQKANPYLPHDMLLKELMGFNYVFTGEIEKGKQLLFEVKDHLPDYAVSNDKMPIDFLNEKADAECIKTIFMRVDEKRESILKKRDALINILKKFPEFKDGYSSLATTWLQLHREGEALEILERLHQVEPNDPTTNYYMATLYIDRMDYNKAWDHLKQTETIVQGRNHHPKALKQLRQKLSGICPE